MNTTLTPAERRRTGWFVGLGLVIPTLVTVVYFVLLAKHPAFVQQTAYVLGKTVQFALPLLALYAERKRIALRGPEQRELLEGAALGVAIVAAMFLLYFAWIRQAGFPPEALEAIRQKIAGIGFTTPLAFAALGTFYALVHSLFEEYYWRWFIFGRLRMLVSLRAAVLVSAIGFTAHHVFVLAEYFGWASLWTWFFSVSVTIGGILWALLYDRRGSLYGPWLSHLLVDAGIFLVGYDLVLRN